MGVFDFIPPRPMPVASVHPEGEFVGTPFRGRVGLSVGPFPERGLDEALRLAVGFRCIGFSADVLETQRPAGIAEAE